MTAETTTTPPFSATAAPRKSYRPQGKRAFGIVDRRSIAWRRRCELVNLFTQALQSAPGCRLDPLLEAKVSEAAELKTVAELTRASFLQGAGATADDVVRTSRAASLAEKRLGISERREKPAPDLASYLASKAAA